MTASQRRWALANALLTDLTDRKAEPELIALAAALARECGIEMPVADAA
jgi:hypothetical protein